MITQFNKNQISFIVSKSQLLCHDLETYFTTKKTKANLKVIKTIS